MNTTLQTIYLLPISITRHAAVIQALGTLGAKDMTEEIAAALGDGNLGVRWQAVSALTTLGAKEKSKEISRLLSDPSEGVRYMAVRGLHRLKAKETAPILVPLLEDDDSGVREATINALGDFGNREQDLKTFRHPYRINLPDFGQVS